jgi:hypothetical protein
MGDGMDCFCVNMGDHSSPDDSESVSSSRHPVVLIQINDLKDKGKKNTQTRNGAGVIKSK